MNILIKIKILLSPYYLNGYTKMMHMLSVAVAQV